MPAFDISISPQQHVYAVSDVIACSARGFPLPVVQWVRHGHSGNPDDDVIVPQPNLTVTEEMLGVTNSWTCRAENELNVEPVSVSIDFTVTGTSCNDFCDTLVSKHCAFQLHVEHTPYLVVGGVAQWVERWSWPANFPYL